jgi:hypothetical protein
MTPDPPRLPRRPWWRKVLSWFLWETHDAVENDDEPLPPNTFGRKRKKRPEPELKSKYAQAAAESRGLEVNEISPEEASDQPPPLPPPVPVWKVQEPPESADPVPHQEAKLEQPLKHWALIGASVRGKQHAHHGTWRDDSFAWGSSGSWTFMAVSDGAGSAELARVGARVACEAAVKTLADALKDVDPNAGANAALIDGLALAAKQARTAIRNESLRRNTEERHYHATLLLVAHAETPKGSLIGALQVGDGTVGIYADGACTVLGESDHGAYSGETRFLTTFEIDEPWENRVALTAVANLQAIAVMTDGVADDFFPENTRLIELFEGNPIEGLTTATGGDVRGLYRGLLPNPPDGQALADWLGYEKRGSFDDRTLVVLFRSDAKPQAADGEQA